MNIASSGFEASDPSATANKVVTIKIVNGRLNVQLVPKTNSDRVVFILSLTTATAARGSLHRDPGCSAKRCAAPAAGHARAASTVIRSDTGSGPVPEWEARGLVANLSALAVKGPAYVPGRQPDGLRTRGWHLRTMRLTATWVQGSGLLYRCCGRFEQLVYLVGGTNPCQLS